MLRFSEAPVRPIIVRCDTCSSCCKPRLFDGTTQSCGFDSSGTDNTTTFRIRLDDTFPPRPLGNTHCRHRLTQEAIMSDTFTCRPIADHGHGEDDYDDDDDEEEESFFDALEVQQQSPRQGVVDGRKKIAAVNAVAEPAEVLRVSTCGNTVGGSGRYNDIDDDGGTAAGSRDARGLGDDGADAAADEGADGEDGDDGGHDDEALFRISKLAIEGSTPEEGRGDARGDGDGNEGGRGSVSVEEEAKTSDSERRRKRRQGRRTKSGRKKPSETPPPPPAATLAALDVGSLNLEECEDDDDDDDDDDDNQGGAAAAGGMFARSSSARSSLRDLLVQSSSSILSDEEGGGGGGVIIETSGGGGGGGGEIFRPTVSDVATADPTHPPSPSPLSPPPPPPPRSSLSPGNDASSSGRGGRKMAFWGEQQQRRSLSHRRSGGGGGGGGGGGVSSSSSLSFSPIGIVRSIEEENDNDEDCYVDADTADGAANVRALLPKSSSSSPSSSPNSGSGSSKSLLSSSPSASSAGSHSSRRRRSSRFRILDRDSGVQYDIRCIEGSGSDEAKCGIEVGYNLFPSRSELEEESAAWRGGGGVGGASDGTRDAAAEDAKDDEQGGRMAGAKIGKKKIMDQTKKTTKTTKAALKGLGKSMKKGAKSARKTVGTKLQASAPTARGGGPNGGGNSGAKGETRCDEETLRSESPTAAGRMTSLAKVGSSLSRNAPNFSKSLSRIPSYSSDHHRTLASPGHSHGHGDVAVPANAVPAKCSWEKPSSTAEYDPMLLLCTIPKAHEGPVWCSAFGGGDSGKEFLATGGQDGTVALWRVAPSAREDQQGEEGEDSGEEQGKGEAGPTDWAGRCCSAGGGCWGDSGADGSGAPRLLSSHGAGGGHPLGTEIRLLSTCPHRRYADHTSDVVDLSWSHTSFLLSASLDKTVRLYHPARPSCLRIFRHADLVTSVNFHPTEDGLFLSGGFDKTLRVWSIPDGRVSEWARAPDLITAARFVPPSGQMVAAGLLRGQVYFYESAGMKYYTQIACRNRRGGEKEGRKVTGLEFFTPTPPASARAAAVAAHAEKVGPAAEGGGQEQGAVHGMVRGPQEEEQMADEDGRSDRDGGPPSDRREHEHGTTMTHSEPLPPRGAQRSVSAMSLDSRDDDGNSGDINSSANPMRKIRERLLVTTNDSRLRLFGLRDYCMIRKYKGLTNSSLQIRAKMSESGKYIISGSDTGHVYIWNTKQKAQQPHDGSGVGGTHGYDRSGAHESFVASRSDLPIVTDAAFMPGAKVRDALSRSGLFPDGFDAGRIRRKEDGRRLDLSAAAVVTTDYDGTLRAFLRRGCLDAAFFAAGPEGGIFGREGAV